MITSNEASETDVSPAIKSLSSQNATEVQVAVEKAPSGQMSQKLKDRKRTEPTGMEDNKDWQFLDVDPIDKNWILV